MSVVRAAVLFVAALAMTGCEIGKRVIITPFYRPQDLPASRVIRDIAYVDGAGAHPRKHRLDLYLPASTGFTTVVFVHGGNWTEGDKSLHVAGADIYGNIGRFFAANGHAVAVVNYRLIPEVSWQAQPADIARAVKWVHAHIAEHGGNPSSIVLMGHSAGAQLASLVAVDPRWLEDAGVPARAIRSVVAISGAGYDIADEETYQRFGHSKEWFARRFHTIDSAGWDRDASPVNFLDAGDPPFLLMYATGEPAGIRRQADVMRAALARAGIWTWFAPISGLNHPGIVLVMSRPDRAPGTIVLRHLAQLSQFSR